MRITEDHLNALDCLRYCERIPVVSTVTSVAILIFKALPKTEEANQDFFIRCLKDTPIWRSIILLIPVIGNICVFIIDANTEEDTAEFFITKYMIDKRDDLAFEQLSEQLRVGNRSVLRAFVNRYIHENNFTEAKHYLALASKDKDNPLFEPLDRAINNDPTGWLDIGLILENEPLIKKAADSGIPLACWEMGIRYERSNKTTQAIDYFKKGASLSEDIYGVAMCQYKLGMLTCNMYMIKNAARLGYPEAILLLNRDLDTREMEISSLYN